MQRTYRALQLADYGLAAVCAVLAVAALIGGRGALGAGLAVAAVWWLAVAAFWGRRAATSRGRPRP